MAETSVYIETETLYDRLGGKEAIEKVVDLFYAKIKKDDRVRHLFKNTKMPRLRKMQSQFLSYAFGGPESYEGKDIAAAHAGRNITNAQFDAVIELLGNTLEELGIEPDLIEEAADVAQTLRKEIVEETDAANAAIDQAFAAVEGSATAMMMVDRDLVVTYANPATTELISSNITTFKEAFPGFSLENLIGTCIDIFHENPAHQRKLLSDPTNLPYRTDIRIGDLTFALNVNAMMDEEDNYVGNSLEWANVTDARLATDRAARIHSAVEGSATAMMMVDRDLVITYVNPSTVDLVSTNLDVFKQAFSGFTLENLVGTCIDIFHENPAHQRKLLADENNLPHRTDIQIGPLTFALNVTAMKDDQGRYIGNCLEWDNVTAARQAANEAARIQSAIEGSATSMMMIDRDFNITYANPATMSMLRENQNTFKDAYPGFDIDNIIGACIDMFHANPAHQRKLLADPSNLPYSADISIGHLSFRLNVSAMRDGQGNYIGNTLEWADITAAKQAEENISNTVTQVDLRTNELNESCDLMVDLSGSMASQVNQITEETGSAASGAEEMSSTMTSISAASEQASANINSVAVATEQLTNSVAEIASNTDKAREVTQDAVKNVENASARVDELDSAAKEISQVIEAIVEIAEQTKLLALNATIEAARAGEAGKGFAVVANEVKELAKQTRDATTDIRIKIENMQNSTNSTVGEIGNINRVMNDVNEIVGIIATSVEEQNAATKDIANNINQASTGVKDVSTSVQQAATVSQEVAENLSNVNRGILEINEGTRKLNTSIDSVKTTSEGLSAMVNDLKAQKGTS